MKKQTNSFLLTDAKVRLFSSRSKKSWINFPHLLRHPPTSATKPIRHSKSFRKSNRWALLLVMLLSILMALVEDIWGHGNLRHPSI